MVKTRYSSGYREYHQQNQWVPSVTSIISAQPNQYITQWKKRYTPEQIDAVLKYAQTRGTLIHYNALQQYCNAFVTQEPPELKDIQKSIGNETMSQEIQIAMVLFKQFRSVFTLEPVAVERVVNNHEIGYAGRVDFQGYLISGKKKIPILMDIKTGKEIYRGDTSLQLTAYNKALDDFAERLYVLLLHPGPTTVDGVTFGGRYAHWSFVRMHPDWKEFIEKVEIFKQLKSKKRYIDYSEWDYV